ncbi:MAG: hypothetical protein ACRDT4_25590, partial [Micromonosporaceae bacterium]
MRSRPLLAIAVFGALTAGLLAVLPSSAEVTVRAGTLTEAVSATMLDTRGAAARVAYGGRALADPMVEPKRSGAGGDWAFGTVVIPVPYGTQHAGPEAALYVARRTAAGWQVALDGTPEFVRLARRAPASVVPAEEKSLFAAHQRAAALLPELPLPTLLPGRPTRSPSQTPSTTPGSPSATPGDDPSASPAPSPSQSPGSPRPTTAPSPTPTGPSASPTSP